MRDQICKVIVRNVPEYANGYIVARVSDNALWYWGCWNDEKEAVECASNVDGIVVRRDGE